MGAPEDASMDVSSLADALPSAGAHARLSSAAPGRGAAAPSADELAILDAVRDDAVARFTARLAPAPGALIGTVIRMLASIVTVPVQRLFTEEIPEDGEAACAVALQGGIPQGR